jgi:hypothetical protein
LHYNVYSGIPDVIVEIVLKLRTINGLAREALLKTVYHPKDVVHYSSFRSIEYSAISDDNRRVIRLNVDF